MNYYKGCKITITVPTVYRHSEKIKKGMFAKFPGASIEFVTQESARKPGVQGAFVPHGHALTGAAIQEKPGTAMKEMGGEGLHYSAADALEELLEAKGNA